MDPLRLAIAFVPLAAYLALLGVVNLRGRPLLVFGANDLATLGMALSGLVFVGPIELFRPAMATMQFGNFIWPVLLALYWLLMALVVMVARPRLVVYNITLEQLRPAVAEAVGQLDPQARWAGDSVMLPRLGVQLHLDGFPMMRNASLVSSGGRQDLVGWQRLSRALSRALHGYGRRPNPRGVGFLTAAGVLLLLVLYQLSAHPEQVAQGVSEILAF